MVKRQKRSMLVYYGAAVLIFLLSVFFDKQLILFVTQLRTLILDNVFTWGEWIFTKTLIFAVALAIIVVKNRKIVIPFVLSSFLSLVVVYVLKLVIGRVRPYLALNLPHVVQATNHSFPSGHAAIAFATVPFVFAAYRNAMVRWVWLALMVVIAFSRMYLGVHYLSDVLAGALIGFGMSYGLLKAPVKKIFK